MTCARNAAVRAVVLSGAGRHFCFGGDLRAFGTRAPGGDDYIRELTTYLHAAISQFMRMDAPVIAAVNGTAAGAGVGLVAMADLALCARSAKFNLAYTNAGLTPDAGTSFLLPRTLGLKRTMELLLLNRTLSAAEAPPHYFEVQTGTGTIVDEKTLLTWEQTPANATYTQAGAATHCQGLTLGGFEPTRVLEREVRLDNRRG